MSDPASKDPARDARWSYEIQPPEYAHYAGKVRALGPGPTRSVIRIARADLRVMPPHPDPVEPYITGRYESDAAAGFGDTGDDCLLHVNQAGTHIEGLLVDISGRVSKAEARVHRFKGDLNGGSFELFQRGPGSARGTLTPSANGLMLKYDFPFGTEHLLHFRLRNDRPTFLDQALESLIETADPKAPARGKHLLAAAEHYPLSTAQMTRLREALVAPEVEQLLRRYFDHAGGNVSYEHLWRANAARALDQYLGRVFDSGHVPKEQADLVREFIRTVLSIRTLDISGVVKSQLQWIEDIVATVGSSPMVSDELASIRKIVGWGNRSAGSSSPGIAAAGVPRFEYELDLKLKHKGMAIKGVAGLRVGGYWGDLTVTSAAPSWAKPRRRTYRVFLAGGGVIAGQGSESDISANATMVTNEEWTPADFPGPIILLDGAAWAGKKVPVLEKRVGVGVRDAALIVKGSQSHTEVIVGLEGMDEERNEVGAEFDFNYGRVFDLDHVFQEEDFSRSRVRTDYEVAAVAKDGHAYFEFGAAPLTVTGWNALRVFAAEWLPWLQSPETTLSIVGHTDTVAKQTFNDVLSDRRAKNVEQALKDILGKHLAVPDAATKTEGHGEAEACAASGYSVCEGRARERPELAFRRVDVYLNGRVTVSFWAS